MAITMLGVGAMVGVVAAERSATAPPLVYSGTVLDGSAPIADGPHTIGLTLYDVPTGGAPLCAVAPASVTTTAGRFSLSLGDPACGAAIETHEDIEVEITVDGTTMPRARAGAVPFAVNAERLVLHHGAERVTYGSYCGATPASTGRIRTDATTLGHVAARRRCVDACGSPTAHFCTMDEMVRSAQLGVTEFPPGWVASGLTITGERGPVTQDCGGWTSNLATDEGFVVRPGPESMVTERRDCDTMIASLCCD